MEGAAGSVGTTRGHFASVPLAARAWAAGRAVSPLAHLLFGAVQDALFHTNKQVFAETPSLSSLPFWFVSCSFSTVYHTVQFIGKKHRTEHRQKVNMQRTHVKYFNLERIATDNLMDIGPLRDPFSGFLLKSNSVSCSGYILLLSFSGR